MPTSSVDVPIGRSLVCVAAQLGVLAVTLILGTRLGLSGWRCLALVGVFVFLLWSDRYRPQLKALSAKSDRKARWHFLVDAGRGDELWQGKALAVRDYGFCVAIFVQVHEPIVRQIRWVVYRDALAQSDWRRLRAQLAFLPRKPS